MKLRILSSVIGMLVATVTLLSPAHADKPRIGLVLGGGGAAGVAHVGVIRELERLGIRPDIVTGTSMGAIIGGLYAAGYTPDDLERVALEVEWDSILNDSANRLLQHPLRRRRPHRRHRPVRRADGHVCFRRACGRSGRIRAQQFVALRSPSNFSQ